MFWAIFKNLETTVACIYPVAFIRVSGSFAEINAFFKALILFLKLHLGKVLFSQ